MYKYIKQAFFVMEINNVSSDMYWSGSQLLSGEKYTKEQRIEKLNRELDRVKRLLKGERSFKTQGYYGVPAADRNLQKLKMNKVNALMQEKKSLEAAIKFEKTDLFKPQRKASSKPKVQYFSLRTGEASNTKKKDYQKVTDELYPIYHVYSDGKMVYSGWMFRGEQHFINGGVVDFVKNPVIFN
jgi:hypothetical protein